MTELALELVVMCGATLAQHLGLTEAVARVVMKIASCPMCCTFWTCLAAVAIAGDVPLHYLLLISISSAYASHWFSLALILFQNIYNSLWQRLTRK